MNNGRDCPHGRQVGKCDTCDLIAAELELQKVSAELKERSDLAVGLGVTLKALCESIISQIGPKFELHQQAKKILATLGVKSL